MRAMKVTAATVDLVARRPAGTVVLLYHRVGRRTQLESDLDIGVFRDQVAAIAATGRATSLDSAVEWLRRGDPADAVTVTFDDGTADLVEDALPVLVEHGVPATVYVATDHVERGVPFPNDGRPVSWAALADAMTTGLLTVGSHTHTHTLLDRVPPDVARRELDRSIELISDKLGVAPLHFAYPKALVASGPTEDEVRRRFRSAAVGGTRPNVAGRTDLHRLQRSPVQATDGMRWFRRKLAGGMAFEDSMRTVLNRRRYAGAVT